MININEFFDRRDPRSYLAAPFNFAEKTIACDGACLAIFPLDPAHIPLINFSYPEKFSGVLLEIMDKANQLDFTKPENIVLPDSVSCTMCKGTGKADRIDCEECDGEGSLAFCNDFHNYDVLCKSCEGDGLITIPSTDLDCPRCRGVGQCYERNQTVIIQGVKLRVAFFSKIATAPDLTVCADNNRLLFKSGDVVGALYATA